jgi:hypothetical protein
MGALEDLQAYVESLLASLATRPNLGSRAPSDYSVMVRNDQPPDSGSSQYEIDAVPMAADTLLMRVGSGDIEGKALGDLAAHGGTPGSGDLILVYKDGVGLVKLDFDDMATAIANAVFAKLVDGKSFESCVEALTASLTGKTNPSGNTVEFMKRDGVTPKVTNTYGTTDGQRTGSAWNDD